MKSKFPFEEKNSYGHGSASGKTIGPFDGLTTKPVREQSQSSHPVLELISDMERVFEASPFNHSILSILDNFAYLRSSYSDLKFPESKYPPLNIFTEDNVYTVELAVAGFSKENLSVTLEGDRLTITGKAVEEPYNDRQQCSSGVKRSMIYRGLARRDFTRVLVIPENALVDSVELKDGILSIKITKIIPQTSKAITYEIK